MLISTSPLPLTAQQAVQKEADHLQIVALTRALQFHIRVAYLDQSGAPPQAGSSYGDGAGLEVNFVEFEEQAEEGITGALLYRESSLWNNCDYSAETDHLLQVQDITTSCTGSIRCGIVLLGIKFATTADCIGNARFPPRMTSSHVTGQRPERGRDPGTTEPETKADRA